MKRFLSTVFFIFYITILSTTAFGNDITTVQLKNRTSSTSSNYPFTFGLFFKKGEVTQGVSVEHENTELLTQFDIKSYWGDGSIKHGVISVIIPQIDANGLETLSIKTGPSNPSNGYMDKTAILSTNIESLVNLSNLSGSGYSGSLDGSLRSEINSSSSLIYWLKGPICTEILVRKQLNNSLSVDWEARFYPGTSYAPRVSVSVNNTEVQYRGNITYDAAIYSGNSSPTLSYSKNNFTQLLSTRWRKIIWQSNPPPATELHYDTSYLVSTKLIPSYDLTITQSTSYIADRYSAFTTGGTDIDGRGYITLPSGQGGGRPDIGILPGWQVQLLKSWDYRMWEITLGHAHLAGHFPHHYRESDESKNGYGGPVTITDRPEIWEWKDLNNGTEHGLPIQIGDTTVGNWVSDGRHLTEYNTIPYLLTGERWYLDQLYYAAAHCLNYDYYGRNGVGSDQSFNTGNGSQGLIYSNTRGVAWPLRVIANAIVFGESSNNFVNYLTEKFIYNIDWFYAANTGANANGKGIFRSSREFGEFQSNGYDATFSPWQHAFMVLSLSDMINKEAPNLSKMITIRDHIGSYTIGVFSNDSEYNRWDGFGLYYGPLTDENGDYFTDITWSDMHTMAVDWDANTPSYTQGLPWTEEDFNNSSLPGDPYSRAYIYLAALSQLGHLTSGAAAYDFVRGSLSTSVMESQPTWALTLSTPVTSTCSNTPQICENQSTCTTAGWNWCTEHCQSSTCETTMPIPDVTDAYAF